MRRTSRTAPYIAACMALCAANSSHAVRYTLDGGMSLGQQYNSNIMLQPSAHSLWGTNINGNAAFAANSESWGANSRLRLENYFYTPDSSLNRQNQYLDAGGYLLSERSRYGLEGNFTDDYMLAYESPLIAGNVLGFGKVHRDLKSIGPSWTYALTELTQGTIGYNFNRTEYLVIDPRTDRGFQSPRYPDSNTQTAFGKLSHRQTERLTLIGDLSYTNYVADSSSFSQTASNFALTTRSSSRAIDYVNFSVGANYDYDPTLDLRFSVGGQYSHSGTFTESSTYTTITGYRLVSLDPVRYVPIYGEIQTTPVISPARDSFGPIFGLSANKQFEQDRLSFSYSRQISPSINGFLLAMDRVSIGNQHEFQPGLVGSADFSYTHQTYPNSSALSTAVVGGAAFSYFQVGADLTYRWAENWSTSLGYRFLLRQSDDSNEPGVDNQQVSLSINYLFDTFNF